MTICNHFTENGYKIMIGLDVEHDYYDEKTLKTLFYNYVLKSTVMKAKDGSISLNVKDYVIESAFGDIHFYEWELENFLKPYTYYIKYIMLVKKFSKYVLKNNKRMLGA